ncbi:MAG: histidine phosphatase family protein [Lachnospiraceae bacterium]|nr:histidine phosphatase family protein [Candidatus Equihabitans merdae]
MSCDFYFVRHGQTYWNAQAIMQGQTNIPLNEVGKEQATNTREILKDVDFDIAFTSPLMRSSETAEIVLEGRDVELKIEPMVIEQAYGISESLPHTGWYEEDSPIYGYRPYPEKFKANIGGESFEALTDRARRYVKERLIPMENQYNCVLVASHGAFLSALFNVFTGNDDISQFWREMLPNAGAARVHLENGVFTIEEVFNNGQENVPISER